MMTEMDVTVGDSKVLRNSSSPCMHIPLLHRSSRDRISSASAAESVNLPFLLAALQYKRKRKRKKEADYYLYNNRTLPWLSATVAFRRAVYADRITMRPGMKERGRKETEKIRDTDVPGQASSTGRVE
ncbi:hypothetical protein ALC57_12268 [Trachymyrmex cornetzi]|uniref:Uncharacterized protein n=1 Tax=Trachymyrmex cornetzi TaxID=471704 RepID=A0A151J0Z7_9HYME|nr:hypothetical protein ALC57_12268 [Trachymyrmex cornetzi]